MTENNPFPPHVKAVPQIETGHRVRSAVSTLTLVCILVTAINCQMDEYSIKAAYLYNFSRYVEWPAGPANSSMAPFVICILGEDPFGNRIDQAIAGKTSGGGQMMEVVRIKTLEVSALRKCQIVFVTTSQKQNSSVIVSDLKTSPVFTVADFSPFAENGGIANLRIDGTKVRVDLNMTAANLAKLKVSGRLQQVANLVK